MSTEKLSRVLQRALNGEEITVGFLGGSITQGCNPSLPKNAYVERVYKWFQETFPETKINKINVGVGATGSLIGVHRVEKDLLVHKPDLIFVEFAANDVPPKEKTNLSYESLIRRILTTLEDTAIVEIFMTLEDGTSAEEEQAAIAKYYGIPTVSYRQEIFKEIKKGTYTWKDIETDEVHPNDRGHGIVAELVTKLLKEAMTSPVSEDKHYEIPQTPLNEAPYEKGQLLSCKEIGFIKEVGFEASDEQFRTIGDGYKMQRDAKEAELVCELEGSHIFLLYIKGIEDIRGKVMITIDDEPTNILDTYFDKGWGNYPETYPILMNGEYKKHRITLTVMQAPENQLVSILGFLVS